jgi:hypothetical protein
MPRPIDPSLRRALERANPQTSTVVEVTAPDVRRVLRRTDEFFGEERVSETPAGTLVTGAPGGLTLVSASERILDDYVDASLHNPALDNALGRFTPDTFLRGLGWQVPTTFERCILRAFTVRLRHLRFAGGAPEYMPLPTIALQIYRAIGVAGYSRRAGTSEQVPRIEYSFAPLLSEPVQLRTVDLAWADHYADATFDLRHFQLAIEHRNVPAPSLVQTGELPVYYFVVYAVDGHPDTVSWRLTSGPTTVASVGTFQRRTWTRQRPGDTSTPWVEALDGANSFMARVDVESYVPTSEGIYALTLPAAPRAESEGIIVFERATPRGTSAALAISAAGSGGPWTPVVNGDVLTVAQQQYHLRLTLATNTSKRSAPAVLAAGVEFRTPIELSAEATVEPLSKAIAVPFLAGGMGEGRAAIVRTGRRDYRDPGTELATQYPDTQLELSYYIAPRHNPVDAGSGEES